MYSWNWQLASVGLAIVCTSDSLVHHIIGMLPHARYHFFYPMPSLDALSTDTAFHELLSFHSRISAEASSRCTSFAARQQVEDPICERLAARSVKLIEATLSYLMTSYELTEGQARERFQALTREDFAQRLAAGTLLQVPLEKALTHDVRGIMAP